MYRTLGVSRVSLRCLSGIVLLTAALSPATAFGQAASAPAADDKDIYDYEQTTGPGGAQPSYPGLPRGNGTKLETDIGPMKARFYGTILFNSSIATAAVVGQEVPLWAIANGGPVNYPDGSIGRNGNNHDVIFTMRQSILGFTLNPGKPSDTGWNPSALVEMDFFGARTLDNNLPENRLFNQPRLRMAYFQLEHKNLRFVFGQDKMIISPLDPVSLSHVGVPLGATAGDLWGWFPQARVDYSTKMGKTGLLAQFGVLRPQFGDAKLEPAPASGSVIDGLSSGLGERTSQPFYQGRIAISPPMRKNFANFGIGAHFGEEKVGTTRNIQSWAVAVDMRLPIDPHFIIRGEGFAGSNLIPFQGGIDQGVATVGTIGALTRIQRVGSGGGWLEAIVPLNGGKDTFYAGAGEDDTRNRNLLPGTGRAKNEFLWASYFRKITKDVTAAVEWSYWDFQTLTFPVATNTAIRTNSPVGTTHVFNVSFAYQF
jgi:hypothetical protein